MNLDKTIFIKDKLYIPTTLVKDKSLLNYWFRRLYEESACQKCDNKPNRHNAQCNACPAYKKSPIKMWSEIQGANGVTYYCLPVGFIDNSFKQLKIDLSQVSIMDSRCTKPFDFNLEFTGTLRTGEIVDGVPTANQAYLVNSWLEKKHGVIEAKTRAGKTVVATYLASHLGVKTLIVAHQTELLENFYKTFESLTNLKQLREETGKAIVKVVNNMDDFDDELDVVLVNYQKFIRKESGQDRIDSLLKGKFGLLVVDECFPRGTRIKTSDGLASIENIKIGDLVYSSTCQSLESESLEIKRVSNISKKKTSKHIIKLCHIFGELLCTENHKIYCHNKKEWLEASLLEVGDSIHFFNDCTQEYRVSEINSIENLGNYGEEVYDLEVEDNHNYFAEGVLVHNCHMGNAICFARFIKALDTRYRLGLSATPKRKDCLEENTKIYTNKGILKIKDIIKEYEKDRDSILIYSKNLETQEIELKPILEVHKVDAESKELVRINDSVICTTDHEFL